MTPRDKSPRDAVSLSKQLSYVLRHAPESIGLALDERGWVEVDALLAALAYHGRAVSREELETIVANSDKQRFALSADRARIRASQGHSVAIELGYTAERPPAHLFHGTVDRFLPAILQEGLRKGRRHHVHLSATRELALVVARRRAGEPIVLEVDAGVMHERGFELFRADNGVWLVAHVPPDFIRVDRG